jgi:hypothetical protein
MIFKLQRQMFPADGPIRAYDKHRHHEIDLPPTEALLGWFGTKLKSTSTRWWSTKPGSTSARCCTSRRPGSHWKHDGRHPSAAAGALLDRYRRIGFVGIEPARPEVAASGGVRGDGGEALGPSRGSSR